MNKCDLKVCPANDKNGECSEDRIVVACDLRSRIEHNIDLLKKQITAQDCKIESLQKENISLSKRVEEYREALIKISEWNLPSTGIFWDDEKTRPISYESAWGSQGAKDFIRKIAKEAIAKAEVIE